MIYKIFYLAGLVCISIIRIRYGGSKREAIILNRDSAVDQLLQLLSGLGFTIIPLLYVFTPWLSFADNRYARTLWPVAGIIGVFVLISALWVLWRAHVDLGRNWAAALQIKNGQALVTQGVYRKWRHPMYTANMLWGIAQFLLLANWIAGPAMLVTFVPFYLVRVTREEKMLQEHFGELHSRYCSQSDRLWPRNDSADQF